MVELPNAFARLHGSRCNSETSETMEEAQANKNKSQQYHYKITSRMLPFQHVSHVLHMNRIDAHLYTFKKSTILPNNSRIKQLNDWSILIPCSQTTTWFIDIQRLPMMHTESSSKRKDIRVTLFISTPITSH